MVYYLNEEIAFPDPTTAEPDGFLAICGDLKPERLLLAYSLGIFPWFDFREAPIEWWCPHERFVIFPSEIHISHSMRTLLNGNKYRVTFGQAFEDVIGQCGALREKEQGAWLGEEMKAAYTKLFYMGKAMSVEVWEGDRLVGGLYGVTLERVFFGESMFSLVPSASKVALIRLAQRMQEVGGMMIDCQLETPHLKSMGGRFISYSEYMKYVDMKADAPIVWQPSDNTED